MRILTSLILAAGLLAATGCRKASDRRQACEHLIDLAKDELERSLAELQKHGDMDQLAEQLREKANASTRSDLDNCEAKLAEKDIDPACISDADSLEEAMGCLHE